MPGEAAGAPGRAERCCKEGVPLYLVSIQGTIHEEGPGGLGGSESRPLEVGGSARRVGSIRGALPPQPHPLLLIKAKNKEAAGEAGFDLTPPSQF